MNGHPMPERPGDGPAPLLPCARPCLAHGLLLREAVETALLLEAVRLAEAGAAFEHASRLLPAGWRRAVVQVGNN